jgi:hypothetical protein
MTFADDYGNQHIGSIDDMERLLKVKTAAGDAPLRIFHSMFDHRRANSANQWGWGGGVSPGR